MLYDTIYAYQVRVCVCVGLVVHTLFCVYLL